MWVCSTEFLRACRGGNYIAFFRLARKATYLQACLMHAHFAKVISVTVLVNISSSLSIPASTEIPCEVIYALVCWPCRCNVNKV